MYILSLDVFVGENSHSDALSEQQRALNIQYFKFDYNGRFTIKSMWSSRGRCLCQRHSFGRIWIALKIDNSTIIRVPDFEVN
jgi:hypothetical protein